MLRELPQVDEEDAAAHGALVERDHPLEDEKATSGQPTPRSGSNRTRSSGRAEQHQTSTKAIMKQGQMQGDISGGPREPRSRAQGVVGSRSPEVRTDLPKFVKPI